jgi:hypothetical protein
MLHHGIHGSASIHVKRRRAGCPVAADSAAVLACIASVGCQSSRCYNAAASPGRGCGLTKLAVPGAGARAAGTSAPRYLGGTPRGLHDLGSICPQRRSHVQPIVSIFSKGEATCANNKFNSEAGLPTHQAAKRMMI